MQTHNRGTKQTKRLGTAGGGRGPVTAGKARETSEHSLWILVSSSSSAYQEALLLPAAFYGQKTCGQRELRVTADGPASHSRVHVPSPAVGGELGPDGNLGKSMQATPTTPLPTPSNTTTSAPTSRLVTRASTADRCIFTCPTSFKD